MSKKEKMRKTCGSHGREEKFRFLSSNPKRNRLPGRPGHRCEDNIKIFLENLEYMVWIGYGPLVNMITEFQVL
jgi:hypothetical protein